MFNVKTFFMAAIVILIMSSFCLVSAQEETKAPEIENVTLGKIFQDGGLIGWGIVILSVIGLALFIGNLFEMRRDKLAPPDVVEEIEALFEAGEYQEAIELCEAEPSYFTNVVASGLPKLSASFTAMEKAIEEMNEEEAIKYHQKLSWLSLIANIAPMAGLLGTVMGMIQSFNVIAATKGQADPSQLSAGISSALITTMFGLIVAIPMTAAFVFLRNKVVKHSIEISAITSDLFERFRPSN
ncbi:MAG: MotA/TolQ/ExbB proton channel family protein [Planctomycetota bacterium]|jgi:biopolymer transport protein ExbB